jgi:hypothetical protein
LGQGVLFARQLIWLTTKRMMIMKKGDTCGAPRSLF